MGTAPTATLDTTRGTAGSTPGLRVLGPGTPTVVLPGPAEDAPAMLLIDDELLAGIGRLPLLTAEEEVALGVAAEAGAFAAAKLAAGTGAAADPDLAVELHALVSAGDAAFTRMVTANIRLAAWLARRRVAANATGGLAYPDLVHEGVLGLIRAVHKWDYRRGLKFSTYAVRWIASYQQRAVRRATGLPVDVEEQQRAIARARAELTAELGRAPTEVEVSLRVGLSVARIATLESWVRPVSLQTPIGTADRAGGQQVLADVIADTGAADPVEAAAAAELRRGVARLLADLPPRQRQVVTLRFGLDGDEPMDVAAVAGHLGVPDRLVATTLAAALATLRVAAAGLRELGAA